MKARCQHCNKQFVYRGCRKVTPLYCSQNCSATASYYRTVKRNLWRAQQRELCLAAGLPLPKNLLA